jgi:hypothetical protein
MLRANGSIARYYDLGSHAWYLVKQLARTIESRKNRSIHELRKAFVEILCFRSIRKHQ